MADHKRKRRIVNFDVETCPSKRGRDFVEVRLQSLKLIQSGLEQRILDPWREHHDRYGATRSKKFRQALQVRVNVGEVVDGLLDEDVIDALYVTLLQGLRSAS